MNEMSRDLELEKQIDAYIKGKLSDEEAQKLWERLLERPDYIEMLETELGVRSILQKSAGTSTTSTNEQTVIYSLKKSWKWMAAAASVAILVVAINFFQIDTNQDIKQSTLSEINYGKNLSSAPIQRSQKSDITTADSLLNEGFEAAISGEVSQALQTYNKIIDEYGDKPAAIQAYLNKGIILYNTGRFEMSIASFTSVIEKGGEDKPVVEEKAHWYLGNAYINIDKLEKARSAIHTVYAMDGIYRKPAFRLLRKLDHELGNIDYDNFEQQIKEGE